MTNVDYTKYTAQCANCGMIQMKQINIEEVLEDGMAKMKLTYKCPECKREPIYFLLFT